MTQLDVVSPPLRRKLVVVDDDALLRGLLATQLSAWGFEVREASSAGDAVKVCNSFDPDCVVLDVDLGPGLNGFQLAEALGRRMPHLAIIFLTRFPDARAFISRLSPDLRGAAYVNKTAIENSAELLDAVNAALNDRGISVRHDERGNRPLANLTSSQLAVLRMMHEGMTNAQIARERGASLSATENLIGRAFRALGIESNQANPRAIAVRLYAENYGTKLR